MTDVAVLRVARPTDDIDALLPFYRDGLGLDLLYRFTDHEGFDGVMLGSEGAPYHFEFTRSQAHRAGEPQPLTISSYSTCPTTAGGVRPWLE
uniref:YycE-like N-terminal domain-containing protein n=1 Tax=Phenylobacterium glaciei TaxID=2803784 RepID=A0A974S8S9_9CAUL|nr:hypothetical protein JKL49_10725 [Phenylobacterium glaciei]